MIVHEKNSEKNMKSVFEKTNLGRIEINNRFVRSATAELTADMSGYVTEKVLNLYSQLSQGDIGLIITGLTEVIADTASYTFMKICDDSYIEGQKELTSVVHNNNGKIISQLVHIGSQVIGMPDYKPFTPSGINVDGAKFKSKAMTVEDISFVVNAFGNAALRAKAAGFDGVQVHAAHGYLVSQFLTPFFNKRKDKYGGDIENRARILTEIIENIKTKCGESFPILIKINASDFLYENGFTFEDCQKVCALVSAIGIDAIEVSGGSTLGELSVSRKYIKSESEEAYHKRYAEILAKELSTPIILVGGIRSLSTAEEIVGSTEIHSISLCRPFIRDANLVAQWHSGSKEKSKCISCNKCFNPKGTTCIFN